MKVVIMDTSMLCCLLNLPGKNTCGPDDDRWDFERVNRAVNDLRQSGAKFVLPLAVIIETGNHISQNPGDRYGIASNFCEKIHMALAGDSPWLAFDSQVSLWEKDSLTNLISEWPNLAAMRISMGDATITKVADLYKKIPGFTVSILTGDQGLKDLAEEDPIYVPRRKRR